MLTIAGSGKGDVEFDISGWSDLSVNLSKRSHDGRSPSSSSSSSDFMMSAVVSIIFLIHLSVTFATLLFKWLNGPRPMYFLDGFKANPENCYVVAFVGGCGSGKPMEGTVIFSLHGTAGNSDDYEILASSNTEWEDVFTRCSHDFFHIKTKEPLGHLIGVTVNLQSQKKFQKWYLNYVTVHDLGTSTFHYFPVNRHLTGISGYTESVTAGKRVKAIVLLKHNIMAVSKETSLWTSRFTSKHTDRPLDVVASVCLCHLLVSSLMLLLLFYVRLDQGNTILFSTSHFVALFAAIFLASVVTTFFQLLYRSYTLSVHGILKNFTPVPVKRAHRQVHQTSNNARISSRMTSPSGTQLSEIDIEGIQDGAINWSANNSRLETTENQAPAAALKEGKKRFRRERSFKMNGRLKYKKMLKSSQVAMNFIKRVPDYFMRKRLKFINFKKMAKVIGPMERFQFGVERNKSKHRRSSDRRRSHFPADGGGGGGGGGGSIAGGATQGGGRKIGKVERNGALRMFVEACLLRLVFDESQRNVKERRSFSAAPGKNLTSFELERDDVLKEFWGRVTSNIRDGGGSGGGFTKEEDDEEEEEEEEEEEKMAGRLFEKLKSFRVRVEHLLHLNCFTDENLQAQISILSEHLRKRLHPRISPSISFQPTEEEEEEGQGRTGVLVRFVVRSLDEILTKQGGECSAILENLLLKETETEFFKLLGKFEMSAKEVKKVFQARNFVCTGAANYETENCFDFFSGLFAGMDLISREIILSRITPRIVGEDLWKIFFSGIRSENETETKKLSDFLSFRLIVAAVAMNETEDENRTFFFVQILRKILFLFKNFHRLNKLVLLATRFALTTLACSQISSFKRLCSPPKFELRCDSCSTTRVVNVAGSGLSILDFLVAEGEKRHVISKMNIVCLLSHVILKSSSKVAHACVECHERSLTFLLNCSMRRGSVPVLEEILWGQVRRSMGEAGRWSRDLFVDFISNAVIPGRRFDSDDDHRHHHHRRYHHHHHHRIVMSDVKKLFRERLMEDVEVLTNKLMNGVCEKISDLLKALAGSRSDPGPATLVASHPEVFGRFSVDDGHLLAKEFQVFGKRFADSFLDDGNNNNNNSDNNENNNNIFLRGSRSMPDVGRSSGGPGSFPPLSQGLTPSPTTDPEKRHLSTDSAAGYSSFHPPSNQNAADDDENFPSAFRMTERARDVRWKHFLDSFSNLSRNVKRTAILLSIVAAILSFNLLVLVCGDGDLDGETANIWVVSLFVSCIVHFVLIEPIKIFILAVVWTFVKLEFFQ